MPHTPFTQWPSYIASAAVDSVTRKVATHSDLDECAGYLGEFSGRISLATAATTCAPTLPASSKTPSGGRLVVVDGALAVLTRAYRVPQASKFGILEDYTGRKLGDSWGKNGRAQSAGQFFTQFGSLLPTSVHNRNGEPALFPWLARLPASRPLHSFHEHLRKPR
jgi:hypothetical protein